ncbi:MAG: isoprenoid biosynthesis glyoxalase ElbB [Myxococcales bacterium]|jgi:enhancing lycopene biosynthesis protein 2|nr:isoprenoid biosynthesis glyoxalase ElbB [Myxococcales bacterium]
MAATKHLTFGVILSGCGFRDGSEIHEATLLLLALDRAGVHAVCFAPDMAQARVIDHLTGEAEMTAAPRSVLAESARLARGSIRPLTRLVLEAGTLDGLAFPGGFGAALNLSDYGQAGARMRVRQEVAVAIEAMHAAQKPQGFICIAPVLAARVLGQHQPRLTIGSDEQTAADLEAMGAIHVAAPVDGVIVDQQNRLASTPAYMLAHRISEVERGVTRLVDTLVAMALG